MYKRQSTTSTNASPHSDSAGSKNLPRINKRLHTAHREIMDAHQAGNTDHARQLANTSSFTLQEADKDLMHQRNQHDSVPWSLVVEALDFCYSKFGKNDIRINTYNDTDRWAPDPNSKEATSDSLVNFLQIFLRKAWAQKASKSQCLAHLQLKLSSEVAAIMTQWVTTTRRSAKEITLLKFLHQLFRLYYTADETYSMQMLKSRQKEPNETYVLLYYVLMKHVRNSNAVILRKLDEVTQNTWVDFHLFEEIWTRPVSYTHLTLPTKA